jgi:hypothetical protein
MTEVEWCYSRNPRALLIYVQGLGYDIPLFAFFSGRRKRLRRKHRLLVCEYLRQACVCLPTPEVQEMISVLERDADGCAHPKELAAAERRCPAPPYRGLSEAAGCLASAAYYATWGDHAQAIRKVLMYAEGVCVHVATPGLPESARADMYRKYEILFADLVRDIFGNPFRIPIAVPSWLDWKSGTVPRIAESIYRDRCFDSMPVLADALEDAGCQDGEILRHCRESQRHVRGCWVLGLLFGRKFVPLNQP